DLPAGRRIRLDDLDLPVIQELRAEAERARAETSGERGGPDPGLHRARAVGERGGGGRGGETGRVGEDTQRGGQGNISPAEGEGAGRRGDVEHRGRRRARVLCDGRASADDHRGEEQAPDPGVGRGARDHGRSTKTFLSTISPAMSTARMNAPLATGRPPSVSRGQTVSRSPISCSANRRTRSPVIE